MRNSLRATRVAYRALSLAMDALIDESGGEHGHFNDEQSLQWTALHTSRNAILYGSGLEFMDIVGDREERD